MSKMQILKQLLNATYADKVFTSNIFFYGKKYKDKNVFFTALIAYTLKNIQHTCNPNDAKIIAIILKNSMQAFSLFTNKHGGLSYNFYQTKPINQYPGIRILRKLTVLQIPDDLDSSSLASLAKGSSNSQELLQLKQQFEHFSYDGKQLTCVPKEYQQTKAYRTWFATKMKHDLDICVMCNILTWVYTYQLPITNVDKDTILFISKTIKNGDYLKKAYLFSPHYKNPAIILYHLARLTTVCNHPEIVQHKPLLINACIKLKSKKLHALENVILTTALYKLGSKINFNITVHQKDFSTFYWFVANPFYNASPLVKNIFSRKKFLHLNYQCKAYYWVLLFELKQISNASILTKDTIQIISKKYM